MSFSAENRTLPLSLWGAAAFISIALLFLAPAISDYQYRHEVSNPQYFNVDRLTNTSDHELVVVMGSSLTHHGFFNDEQMEQAFADLGKPIRFVRFTANGATAETYLSVLPEIVQAAPSLLVVEQEMLIHDRSVSSLTVNLRKVFASIRNFLFRSSGVVPQAFKGNFGKTRQCEHTLDSGEAAALDAHSLGQSRFKLTPEELLHQWDTFFAAMNDLETRVVLLELGRSPAAHQGLTEEFKTSYTQRLDRLTARIGASYWRFSGFDDQDAYCDLAHLNERGREQFVEKVVPYLIGEGLD